MLRSIKQLYGEKLSGSDGEIGHVKDLYFDDRSWVVRYLVADTGSWLAGRQVLISPHAFGGVHEAGKELIAKLTRKQIDGSPSIEEHKPVSRQYEEEYHQYYGWPYYWQGDSLWGMTGFPILEAPMSPVPVNEALLTANHGEGADAHLQSTKAVNGYHVQANDGLSGHITDFVMDTQSWAIRSLVIRIGHRFSGKEVQIPTGNVDQVNYEESSVSVNLTIAEIEQRSANNLDRAEAVH